MFKSRAFASLLVGCTALSLMLTGCGQSQTESPAGTDQTAAPAGEFLPPAEGTTQYPLTLTTRGGRPCWRSARNGSSP